MTEPRVFDLVWWITERHAIKERREAGMLPPWTADPVMAGVRFCNVHREDDKVTRWMRQNWNQGNDPAWKFVLGRMINYIPTMEELQGLRDLILIKSQLKSRRDRGEKVFTSAYTISTNGRRVEKIDYVTDHVVRGCMEMGPLKFSSLQETFDELIRLDGLGSFLTAQVLADMKNTKHHPLFTAPDKKTFVAHGPGSIRGLAAFFNTNVSPSNFKPLFIECRKLVDPLIPEGIPEIDNQDFQNSLCELSKYIKVKEGGHARNKYDALKSEAWR